MRVFVTGAGGQLGRDLARALTAHETVLATHRDVDIADAALVHSAVRAAKPDVVIHAGAWTDVDGCEGDPARARRVNAVGAQNVVTAADGAFVIVVSTDYVFDGTLGRAYVETDATDPLQVYGESKLAGERLALAASDRVAVARTAWLYGSELADGSPAKNFVRAILSAAPQRPLDVVDDQIGSPTWTGDLARALVELATRQTPGVFHVANAGAVSRYDFARAIVASAGFRDAIVRPVRTADAPARPAARPLFAPIAGKAWAEAGFDALAPWEDALMRAMREINAP